jgi:hypothetical protein
MSFFKKLFGGSGASEASSAAPAKPTREVEHSGFLIRATPFKEGHEFQTCGVISKEIDGETKEHRFIRADRFSDIDTASEVAIAKGKQMIDQMGDRIFD